MNATNKNNRNSIYDYEVRDISGRDISLSEYRDKVILIVNTATGCGFTPQYKELQSIYEKYSSKGFEILDFPCNQFGNQAPGADDEIANFCDINYGVTFPQFHKIDVNGDNEDPLYTYLKSQQKGTLGGNIKWNFTKFLIDKSGNVVKRYAPTKKPIDIEKDIQRLL